MQDSYKNSKFQTQVFSCKHFDNKNINRKKNKSFHCSTVFFPMAISYPAVVSVSVKSPKGGLALASWQNFERIHSLLKGLRRQFWTCILDVKTSVWALTETLAVVFTLFTLGHRLQLGTNC